MIGELMAGYIDNDFSGYIRQLFGQNDISIFYKDEK
jgi:hypothetical protein